MGSFETIDVSPSAISVHTTCHLRYDCSDHVKTKLATVISCHISGNWQKKYSID